MYAVEMIVAMPNGEPTNGKSDKHKKRWKDWRSTMKTPEQMAEEYCEDHDECEHARNAFLAGYEAAKLEGMRPKTDVIGDALNSSAARHAVALLGDKPINPPIPSDQELHLRAMTSLSIGTSSHTNIQFVPGMGWVKKV